MSKQTLLSLLLGHRELNCIKGCVVVGFGPVLRETDVFGENPFYEKKWFTVMLLLGERYPRNAILIFGPIV